LQLAHRAANRQTGQWSTLATSWLTPMLVAWRRIEDMPDEPETRLWLYGVARNVLANHNRSRRRRRRLGTKLRQQLTEVTVDLDPIEASTVTAAVAKLPDVEREVLILRAGEDLSPSEIAQVLGLNPRTVRTHLQRARARLRADLDANLGSRSGSLRHNEQAGHEDIGTYLTFWSSEPEEIQR
jgi:RNA polymerase sigma factor (sigma-70 family)